MKSSASILLVHKDYSVGGGVERVTLNLARQFRSDGHLVCFFVSDGESSGGNLISNEFPVVFAAGSKIKKFFKLNRLIKDQCFDYVISAKEQANLMVWLASWLNKKFFPVFTRHCAFEVSGQNLPPFFIRALYNLYSIGRGRIVSVSSDLAKDIKRSIINKRTKVEFCPNPVIGDDFFYLSDNNTEGFIHSRPYICGVGRLCEQKGFDLLIKAYSKAKFNNSDFPDLLLVGEGPDRTSLTALADELGVADCVRFVGFSNNPYYIMKHAVVFALSSRHEGLPTVLIEALAVSTNVVAFDCPTGPREILRNGEYGYLVPNGDLECFAEALKKAVVVPRRISLNAVKIYSHKSAAQAYYKVFSS